MPLFSHNQKFGFSHPHSAVGLNMVTWAVNELSHETIVMHQSFVTTASPPPPTPFEGGWVIAGLKCWAITFQVSSQCRGNDRVLTLGSLPQGD